MSYVQVLHDVIGALSKLPGIGPRSAERVALHILRMDEDAVKNLSERILEVKQKVSYCPECHNLVQDSECNICTDGYRDRKSICVVSQPNSLAAMERAGQYKGLYHVLMGTLSPLDGTGPDDLTIRSLITRIKGNPGIEEVIIATDADSEGEATALYLVKILKPLGAKLTRLASGIPVGGSVDYTDRATLGKAIEGRHAL